MTRKRKIARRRSLLEMIVDVISKSSRPIGKTRLMYYSKLHTTRLSLILEHLKQIGVILENKEGKYLRTGKAQVLKFQYLALIECLELKKLEDKLLHL